jgi:hypothetical protein
MTKEEEQRVRDDFKLFLYLVWVHLHLPPPTPVQFQIADYLQDIYLKRKIISGFRGVGKSWITSAFVCWLLWRDKQVKILVVSASKGRSDDFSTFTQRLIQEMPLLQHMIPKSDQRQSKVAFDVYGSMASHAPSVKSLGITSQLTGSRANYIIADDVEVTQNSATADLREKLLKTVTEFEAILTPDTKERQSQIIYLGTPQTEESIYNKLREKGYNCRIWTAEVPAKDTYNGALAQPIVDMMERGVPAGDPVDPQRFTKDDLEERKLSYGKSGYALQYMLDTSLSDSEKYPLKTSDLVVVEMPKGKAPASISYGSSKEQQIKDLPNVGFEGDRWYRPLFIDKDWADFTGSVMSIDPSGRGSDETGYAVVRVLHGYLYVVACGGITGGYSEDTLFKLAQIAKDHQVNEVIIESNFGDGMYTELLKPIMQAVHPCRLEEVSHHTQKERRIVDTLEPIMNQHRLIFDYAVVKKDLQPFMEGTFDDKRQVYSLFYQMTRLTKDRGSLKHDDRLDALSIAVAYWLKVIGNDPNKMLKNYKDKMDEQALEEYFKDLGISENIQRKRVKYRNV